MDPWRLLTGPVLKPEGRVAKAVESFGKRGGPTYKKPRRTVTAGIKLVHAGPSTMVGLATGTGGINVGNAFRPYRWSMLRHLGADLLAQQINGHFLPVAFKLPIGPAIAAWGALQMGTDLMD